jgi:predicted nucleotidyltransferase
MYHGKKQDVLEQFFRRPRHRFQLRELSRESGVSAPSVKNYLQEFKRENLVEEVEEGVYKGYRGKLSEEFKLQKKLYNIEKLHETGLVEEIEEECVPDTIVLFGSAAEGEDIEESDVDLLVVSGEKDLDLKDYEQKFNREINITFMTEKELKQNEEFSNSVANGIVLSGYLVVK